MAAARVDAQSLNRAIEEVRKGRKADRATAEEGYDALKKYTRDLTEAAREGKLDPVIGRDEEIRRTSPRRPWPTATCSTSSCKCSTTGV